MLTIEEALKDGSMCIHEDSGNIMADFGEFFSGNYDGKVLDNAEFLVAGSCKTQPVQHCHIEPVDLLRIWMEEDVLPLYLQRRFHFFDKARCSEALGIPESRIRIVKPCGRRFWK